MHRISVVFRSAWDQSLRENTEEILRVRRMTNGAQVRRIVDCQGSPACSDNRNTVSLHGPDKLNAFNNDMYSEVMDSLKANHNCHPRFLSS